jgi:hypothetical protein
MVHGLMNQAQQTLQVLLGGRVGSLRNSSGEDEYEMMNWIRVQLCLCVSLSGLPSHCRPQAVVLSHNSEKTTGSPRLSMLANETDLD